MRRPGLLLLLSVTAWWTAEGVAWAARDALISENEGRPSTWGENMGPALVSAWMWIPITLCLVWLVRRYPLERTQWPRSLLVLSLAVAAALALRIAGIVVLNPWMGWYDALPSLSHLAMVGLTYNLFIAWMIIGVAHALLFAERARQRERHAVGLETSLAKARLQALSARLNPHFLFNTLNTIAEQVHRNPEAADRMLVGLGALLRRNLDEDGTGSGVALGDELELLSQYLDIEKMRLGDRLQVDWQIAPETLDARVPHLLLQPLAENAIHHAISRRTSSGLLTVRALRRDGRLVLEIEDDGGPGAAASNGHGIGLSTTRARLQYQYGDDHALSVDTRDGGTLARIVVPYSEDAGLAH